jgi:hypothetical protein
MEDLTKGFFRSTPIHMVAYRFQARENTSDKNLPITSILFFRDVKNNASKKTLSAMNACIFNAYIGPGLLAFWRGYRDMNARSMCFMYDCHFAVYPMCFVSLHPPHLGILNELPPLDPAAPHPRRPHQRKGTCEYVFVAPGLLPPRLRKEEAQ